MTDYEACTSTPVDKSRFTVNLLVAVSTSRRILE